MRETLRRLGYKSTLHYLEAMCELVLRETSLLPHPNPGLLSAEWISRLAEVSPSMGLMLETTNASLLAPGAAHDNAPDKLPARRLRTIEEAGKRCSVYYRPADRNWRIARGPRRYAARYSRPARAYGHIQEVIVQNFRAKPTTHGPLARAFPWRDAACRGGSSVANARREYSGAPNLSAPYYDDLMDAGINDWGGISPLTPDFINPEKPWPHLDQLRLRTESKGFPAPATPGLSRIYLAVTSKPGLLAERLRTAAGDDGLSRRAA